MLKKNKYSKAIIIIAILSVLSLLGLWLTENFNRCGSILPGPEAGEKSGKLETIYYFSQKTSQIENCAMENIENEESLFSAWRNLSGLPSCIALDHFSVEFVPEMSPYPYIIVKISKEMQPYIEKDQTVLWKTLSQTIREKYGKSGKATVTISVSDIDLGEIPVYEERADNLSMDCTIILEEDPVETIYYFSEKTSQIESCKTEILGGNEELFYAWRDMSRLPADITLKRFDVITGQTVEITQGSSKMYQYISIDPIIEIELNSSTNNIAQLFQTSLLETLAKTAKEKYIKNYNKNNVKIKIFAEGDVIYEGE